MDGTVYIAAEVFIEKTESAVVIINTVVVCFSIVSIMKMTFSKHFFSFIRANGLARIERQHPNLQNGHLYSIIEH